MDADLLARPSPVPEPLERPTGPARFTEAEYFHMYAVDAFQGARVDLVWGELEWMAPSGVEHGLSWATIVGELYALYDRKRFVIAGDVFTRLFPAFIRAPDVVVARLPVASKQAVEASEVVLAVEVAQSSRGHDLKTKALDYARAGIPHYWVVDVVDRATHVFARPGPDGYAEHATVPFGQPLNPPETGAVITLDG